MTLIEFADAHPIIALFMLGAIVQGIAYATIGIVVAFRRKLWKGTPSMTGGGYFQRR